MIFLVDTTRIAARDLVIGDDMTKFLDKNFGFGISQEPEAFGKTCSPTQMVSI